MAEDWKKIAEKYWVLGIPLVGITAGTLAVLKVGAYLWEKAEDYKTQKEIDALMKDALNIPDKKAMILDISNVLGPKAKKAAEDLEEGAPDEQTRLALEVVKTNAQSVKRK